MKIRILLLIVLCVVSLQVFSARSYKVNDVTLFNEIVKIVSPGDSIILSNGTWTDVDLKLKGNGMESAYVYLMAETPGKVFIEGKSRLQLSGKFLNVSGLVFRNGRPLKTSVIEFRTGSGDYANNSVVSNCVIDNFSRLSKDTADHWVDIYGKYNRVEYCYFAGKSNEGTTLVVWPNDSSCIDNHHVIYRNYFGYRPRLGSNGGETIRIGTSQVCHLNSVSIVEGNYFERCNGEVEVISNKSGGNKFLNNTFFECEGSLVLRHGNNAVVAGNWFVGNGKAFTGGVRVINEGHLIYNNFFYKLRGEDFRSPLVIMNAIPNSPANGYAAVKNVVVANNTYVDCTIPWAFGVGAGERDRTVTPESTLILNNLVYSPNETELIKVYDKTDRIRFDNNLMVSKSGMLSGEGTVNGEIEKKSVWGIDYISSKIKAKKLAFIKNDILGLPRDEANIGAFQNKEGNPVIELATAQNCGPDWYKPKQKLTNEKSSQVISVAPGTDLLTKAVSKASAGDVLVLEEGLHIITRKIVLSKSLIFRDSENARISPEIIMDVQRENASFFEIEGNPTIRFENIRMNGNSNARFPAKYAIVTSKETALGYNLFIDKCELYDFNVESGSIFNAYKGTIADTIKIINSVLRNSYRGLILSQEKDNVGKYSAESVIFENSVFANIAQYAIDYYRGGTDESTLGGNLMVNHCVFDLSAKEEKQYVIKTSGIIKVSIKNSIFSRSMAKVPVRLSGQKNEIRNCNFFECADPKIDKGATSSGLIYENPRFEKKSYSIVTKSKLKGKADDGGNIGLK